MDEKCPYTDKCPIFAGILGGRNFTRQAYMAEYCENGEGGRVKCRRWQCKQKFGKVPEDVLPNSCKTIEEIGKENDWQAVSR